MSPFISQALTMLSRNYLLDSIALVRQYAVENRNSSLSDSLNRIEQSYRFLLKYLADGVADPSRERMFNDLRYELYAIVRNIALEEESKAAPTLYYSTFRTVRFSNMKFSDALGRFISADAALELSSVHDESGNVTEDAKKLLNEKDRAIKDIFSIVWTLPVGDRRQLEAVVNVAADADISFQLRATIVSALTLAILQAYDARKIAALLDIDTKTSDLRIKARTIAGLILALNHYHAMIKPDHELDTRFEAWRDDLANYPRLRDTVYAIVKTRGSRKMSDRITREVMPGIIGPSQDLFKDLAKRDKPISLEELQENPEWEKAMHDSGLDKKLRKLHNLYDKGADMMLPMFNQLASHHFFKDIDTWFRPFELWEADRLGLDPNVAKSVADSPAGMMMCDADKFALLLYLSRLPGSTKDMMNNAFSAGREQMEVEMNDMALHLPEPEFTTEVANYARTLFRFFNLFRSHREFLNPFEDAIPFSRLPWIGDMLAGDEVMRSVAETYFQQDYYQDATEVFEHVAAQAPAESAMIYQKIGFCYEKDQKPLKALDNYLRADTLRGSDDRWLLERIYLMAKATKKTVTLVQTINRLLSLDKDNTYYLSEWVGLMIDLDIYSNYPDYVELFEKRIAQLAYLEPESPSVLTLQARAAALRGDWNKVVEIFGFRRADVEMYLAASSLGGKQTAEADEATEKAMRDDMLILANAYAACANYAEAISALKMLRMLKYSYSADELSERMDQQWRESESLSSRRLMIPMLIEASA